MDQVAGKLEMRNRKIKLEQSNDLVLVHEICDVYALDGKSWVFYSNFRASTLMKKLNGKWKFIHQHSSFPDARTSEGENIAIDKIAEENRDLREAVKRHTIELEQKNRELEIEAALEHVRSLALGMHKSEEVGNVTDSFFNEFNKLSVDVIGCSIVVIDEDKDTMELWRARSNVAVKPFEVASFKRSMQVLKKHVSKWFPVFYEALRKRDKYLIEEMPKRKRTQLLNSIAEQYNYTEREKSKLLKVTPEKITAHFLFFKLGYLALITEKRLPEENLAVAGRFVEVFDFAYTRFLDIKNAEEQAREAEIQLALERVRARTMAMHHSDEIDSVGSVLFHQLQQLNIPALRRCLIGIVDEANGMLQSWFTSMKGDSSNKIIMYPISGHPVIEAKIKSWRERKPFSIELKGKKIKNFVQYTMSHGFELPKGEVAATYMIQNHAPFKYGYLEVATHEPLSDDDFELLQRFAKVFEQTYTRFLDLQKAELQAREAEIQTSLERVRASAMAMHKSEELLDVCEKMFKEFLSLGFDEIRNAIINIHNDTDNSFINYDYAESAGKSVNRFTNDVLPFVSKMMKISHSANDAFSETHISGKTLAKFINLRKQTGQ
ncbi:MAG: nuclear transport factor 2 family protein, partial [Ignavibacteriaceae bacterium]